MKSCSLAKYVRVLAVLALFAVLPVSTGLAAEPLVVTDQLGRTVTIPTPVKRVVCLHHHTLDIILELQQGDKLVGIVDQWSGLLGDSIAKIYPRLKELPTPGGLNAVNVEAVAALKPDVVFFAHQLPAQFIDQLEQMGIPAVGISLYVADREQASTLSPDLIDPDAAYTEGMDQAVRLIGKVLGADDRAGRLLAYVADNRKLVARHLAEIAPQDRIKVFMANPDMYTYGTGKYVGAALNRAGAHNVAEAVKGYRQVNMEQIAVWNPDVIFVQSRYQSVLDDIRKDPAWAEISAVKTGRLYLAPDYAKPWGHPCPESMALGELWLARLLYPAQFADVDMDALVQDFYRTFYGVDYKDTL